MVGFSGPINECVAGDNRINKFFAQTASDEKRLSMFKGKLVDQICEASGGPCKYTGKNMKEAHAGMGVKEEHFNALVEDLVKALDKFKVPEKEKGELLGAIGPLKPQIVAPKEKLEKQKLDPKELDKVTKFAATQKDECEQGEGR